MEEIVSMSVWFEIPCGIRMDTFLRLGYRTEGYEYLSGYDFDEIESMKGVIMEFGEILKTEGVERFRQMEEEIPFKFSVIETQRYL